MRFAVIETQNEECSLLQEKQWDFSDLTFGFLNEAFGIANKKSPIGHLSLTTRRS